MIGTPVGDWEAWLAGRFPGYLLPGGESRPLDKEAAEAFLQRFDPDRRSDLELVCAASLFSSPDSGARLREFVHEALPDLLRSLPSETRPERREWRGGFRGRLDPRATLQAHMAGDTTTFVTQDRHRHFDLPENLLVRAVVGRLLHLGERLERAGLLGEHGWGEAVLDVLPGLRRLLWKSRLAELPDVGVEAPHRQAAQDARHHAYELALHWNEALEDALDRPETRARHLARGALSPKDAAKRFELAVALRWVASLHDWASVTEPGRWKLLHTAVLPGRDEIAVLQRDDGASIRFWYDSVPDVLPRGAHALGAEHYLGSTGRMRPDVTIAFQVGGHVSVVVVEVKFTEDVSYMVRGLGEAHLYRHEFGAVLRGWPKAVLVVPKGRGGAPSLADEVVAVGWDEWLAVEGMTSRLVRAGVDVA